jgi:hypothetical protein
VDKSVDIVDTQRYRDMRYGGFTGFGKHWGNVWKMVGKNSSRYVTICYRDILWRNLSEKGKNKIIVSLGKKVTVSYRLHTYLPTIPTINKYKRKRYLRT